MTRIPSLPLVVALATAFGSGQASAESLRAALVLPANAREAVPALMARLTPPTSVKGATKIAFADAAGSFAFNVAGGRYLFEILAGDRLLFQKVLTLDGRTYLRVDASGETVREAEPLARVTVEQRHQAVLALSGGQVGVYIGDITDKADKDGKKRLDVVIFRPGPEQAAWRTKPRQDPKVALRTVERSRLSGPAPCRDVSIVCDVAFQAGGRQYTAVVLPNNRSGFSQTFGGKDTADVVIFQSR